MSLAAECAVKTAEAFTHPRDTAFAQRERARHANQPKAYT
jgi:hypothetical protein